ncbi:Uncharacterized protein dnm_047880 [Desulfonema magnum]|uniref:Uncharacterized protein n=1 Tax=Desulfonema magnum TaxID=45655 RepID=A0A975BNF2_9BACT|nr:Uncharacterized protein dnm_047880 [Desulfonema magnum]
MKQFFKLFFGQFEKLSCMILMRPVFPNFTPQILQICCLLWDSGYHFSKHALILDDRLF